MMRYICLVVTFVVLMFALLFIQAPHYTQVMFRGDRYDVANLEILGLSEEPDRFDTIEPVCDGCTTADDCLSYHNVYQGYRANGLREEWEQQPCDPTDPDADYICQVQSENCGAYCASVGEVLADGSYLAGVCVNSTEDINGACGISFVNDATTNATVLERICRYDPNYLNPNSHPFGRFETATDQLRKCDAIIQVWNEDNGVAPTDYRTGLDIYSYWLWIVAFPILVLLGFIGGWPGYQFLAAAVGFVITAINVIRSLFLVWIVTIIAIAVRHPGPLDVANRDWRYSAANLVVIGTWFMSAGQILLLIGYVMWMRENDSSPRTPKPKKIRKTDTETGKGKGKGKGKGADASSVSSSSDTST